MTTLAPSVFSPSMEFGSTLAEMRQARYLSEVAGADSDDRREIFVTFNSGYDEAKRNVIDAAVSAVNRLLQLPVNWDEGGARQISELAAVAAIEWLDRMTTSETMAPHVVPLTDGGVQLEWIAAGQAFEVEVGPSGDVGVLGVDADGNAVVEGEFALTDNAAVIHGACKFLAAMFRAPGAVWR